MQDRLLRGACLVCGTVGGLGALFPVVPVVKSLTGIGFYGALKRPVDGSD